jgi:hypothetical protein
MENWWKAEVQEYKSERVKEERVLGREARRVEWWKVRWKRA